MANKFLDLTGLQHFLSKIKALLGDKVDKVDGKGLSERDYSTPEKNKLNAIEQRAQVNIIESVKLNGATLSVDAKSVNLDLTNYALKTDITSLMKMKGSKPTYADLPKTNNIIGDTWNVETDGMNWTWLGDKWDSLGQIIDLSGYYDKAEADARFANKNEIGENVIAITDAEIDLLFA